MAFRILVNVLMMLMSGGRGEAQEDPLGPLEVERPCFSNWVKMGICVEEKKGDCVVLRGGGCCLLQSGSFSSERHCWGW